MENCSCYSGVLSGIRTKTIIFCINQKIHSFITKLFCSWCCHFFSRLPSCKVSHNYLKCVRGRAYNNNTLISDNVLHTVHTVGHFIPVGQVTQKAFSWLMYSNYYHMITINNGVPFSQNKISFLLMIYQLVSTNYIDCYAICPLGIRGAAALMVGSVPRRIVSKLLRQFH